MCEDCQRLYDELQKQEAVSYGLRKHITSLRGELKFERREKEKLLKELKEKRKHDHYRNGQKRGQRGFHG